MIRIIIVSLAIGITTSCVFQSSKVPNYEECEELHQRYMKLIMDNKRDSAEISLRLAADCDTLNLQYLIELYGLNKQEGRADKALGTLEKIENVTGALEFKTAKELMLCEIEGSFDTVKLNEYYRSFKERVQEEGIREQDIMYYVALAYFFDGGNFAMDELQKGKQKFGSEARLLEAVEEFMTKGDSLYVVRKVFNVYMGD